MTALLFLLRITPLLLILANNPRQLKDNLHQEDALIPHPSRVGNNLIPEAVVEKKQ